MSVNRLETDGHVGMNRIAKHSVINNTKQAKKLTRIQLFLERIHDIKYA